MKTYAEAGVDIKKDGEAVASIVDLMKLTFKNREGKEGQVKDLGTHFANTFQVGSNLFAMSTDGVGSKILLAEKLNKYDTIGIDMVAMVANDLICIGAEPLVLVDYLAVEKMDPPTVLEIMNGVKTGADQAGMAVIGGETATLPDMIKGCGKGTGFDLAGTGIGLVKEPITGEQITKGDAIVGIPSSGVHSNGFSLARKVLDTEDTKIVTTLLAPTTIYVKPTLELLNTTEVHGLANITGGGLLNLPRVNSGFGYDIDNPLKPQPIFDQIQSTGISESEMYKTFNMGMGFTAILPEANFPELQKQFPDAKIVGTVTDKKGVRLRGKEIKGKKV